MNISAKNVAYGSDAAMSIRSIWRYGGAGDQSCILHRRQSSLKSSACKMTCTLLDASVRHLGTDINYVVLENLYAHLKDKVEFLL